MKEFESMGLRMGQKRSRHDQITGDSSKKKKIDSEWWYSLKLELDIISFLLLEREFFIGTQLKKWVLHYHVYYSSNNLYILSILYNSIFTNKCGKFQNDIQLKNFIHKRNEQLPIEIPYNIICKPLYFMQYFRSLKFTSWVYEFAKSFNILF